MDATDKLLEGFRRFRAAYFEANRRLFRHLVRHGQTPKVMVVACSDSRVDPAIVLDAAPGDLFVVRNVANLVPPYAPDSHYHGTSAALEFAVRVLEVEEIVVLGHARCGGIAALMGEPPQLGDADSQPLEFITAWTAIAARARDQALADEGTGEARLRACEQAAIAVSLENLLTFPWVRRRVEEGRLGLHGWYFDIESGTLYARDPQSGRFAALD